jgi:DNA repair ATPase RecN
MADNPDKEQALAAVRRRIRAAEERIEGLRAEVKAMEERLYELDILHKRSGSVLDEFIMARDHAAKKAGALGAHAQTAASAEAAASKVARALGEELFNKACYRAEDGRDKIRAKADAMDAAIEDKREELKTANRGLDDLWESFYSISRGM